MPKLSIITVNLNNVEGLKKTIQSVINQTFTDYEYIIIDGGSTDGSVDVIKKYEDKITYWISEPDRGIYNAMNKGIRVAKGQYCLFLNSGDWLIDNFILEKVFDKEKNEDFIYGNVIRVPYNKIYDGEFNIKKLLYKNIQHQAIFYKKELFNIIGLYNEKYKISADYALNIKIFTKNFNIKFIDEIISYCDTNGISYRILDINFYYDINQNFFKPFKNFIPRKKLVEKAWNTFKLLLENDISFIKGFIFLIKISFYSKAPLGFIYGLAKLIKR